jgi:phasin family protein
MQQTQLVDLYRNGIKTAADMARMSLEGTVRLQEKQLEIVRNILDEQSRSADEITRAGSMEELMSLQSRLAATQLGRVVEFWTSVWQAAAQNGAQGLGSMQAFATRSAEDVARVAAQQVSRAAGSIGESADAANQERKAHRKSA